MTESAIALQNLTKSYGRLTALSDLTLDVPSGQIIGFLGPNGAGKTTTIRLMAGFLKPTSGTVQLLGRDMADPTGRAYVYQRLGFVPDMAGIDATLTGRQLLNELADLQGQPPIDRDHLIDALDLNRLDLQRPLGQLSRGTRQKVNLIQGLQHRPELLILDEPTEALDPLTKNAVHDLLRQAHARGATIFFSSHILSEVEALCDRVALIRRGRLLTVQHLTDLHQTQQRHVTLTLATDTSITAIITQLQQLDTLTNLTQKDNILCFTLTNPTQLIPLLPYLTVTDLTITPPKLEEIFLQYYKAQAVQVNE